MTASALAILKVVLGFGLVIFLHELGHFIMARRNGVFVEKFAIGFDFFGAKIYSWHSGGTEYVIGALPLGGYVKMKGQNDLPEDEQPGSIDEDSFLGKTVGQRTQIISAGVIANFLSAFALCWVAMLLGYHSTPAEVGTLSFDSLEAGLQPGDRVVEVAGKKVSSWEEMVIRYATREPGSTFEMLVERDGEPVTLQMTVHRDERLPINYPDFSSPVDLRVGSVQVDSAADKAGVEPGDHLLTVDGHEITSWSHFQELIRRRADTELELAVFRPDPKSSRAEQSGDDPPGERLTLTAHTTTRNADGVPKYRPVFLPDHPAVIDYVEEGSTGWQAGLRPGDRVERVGSEVVTTWYWLWREATWGVAPDQPVTLTYVRGEGPPQTVSVPPGEVPEWGLGTHALPALGLAGRPPEELRIGALLPGAPEGLMVGDRIVAFKAPVPGPSESRGCDEGGEPTTTDWEVEDPNWATLVYLHDVLAEPRLELEVERGGKRHTFTMQVREEPEPVTIGLLGVGPLRREVLIKRGPIEAIVPSIKAPFRILKDFVDGIRAMAMRRASARLMAGPLGILQATYTYAEKSTGDLANFLALLSVNLAIVNFLPIPITDGGHFIFLMYEKVKGRRMDEQLEARFQWAGLVFILLLFLFATFNDFGRIFGF